VRRYEEAKRRISIGNAGTHPTPHTDLLITAITYLTLPTISTATFGVFPCDRFDTGDQYLRNDYAISCLGAYRSAVVLYAIVILALFPIGVPSFYTILLWKNRKKIKQPVEVRSKDQKLVTKRFLFQDYKPKFWWFEIFETLRRLSLTGFLSIVNPGTDSQFAVGILLSVGSLVTYALFKPYISNRDNALSILSNAQIFCVFLTAFVMKRLKDKEEEAVMCGAAVDINDIEEVNGSLSDSEALGYLLIVMNLLNVVVFAGWGYFKSRQRGEKDGEEDRSSAFKVLTKNVKSTTSNILRHENPLWKGGGRREEGGKAGMMKKKKKLGMNRKKKDSRAARDSVREMLGTASTGRSVALGTEQVMKVNDAGLLEVGGVEGRDSNKSSSEDEFDSDPDSDSSNEPEAPPPRAPKGWETAWDSSHKRFYFFERQSGDTRWSES